MQLSTIIARDLPEAWYLCIKECMDNGHDWKVANMVLRRA